MRKILSITLSVIMAFSLCFTTMMTSVAASEATTTVTDSGSNENDVAAALSELRSALNAANTTLKNEVKVSVDGSDVSPDMYWVTQAEYNALDEAFDDPWNMVENPEAETTYTSDEVKQALADFESAVDSFKAAMKQGTQTSSSDSNENGVDYEDDEDDENDANSDDEDTSVFSVDVSAMVRKAVDVSAIIRKIDRINGDQGSIRVYGVDQLASSDLGRIAKAANAKGKNITMHVDTMDGNKVVSRLYIDVIEAAALGRDINLKVTLNKLSVMNLFTEYFDNNLATVTFNHSGTFGMSIPVAVAADISNMNVDSLIFYVYNSKTNTYRQVNLPYAIDRNGYLHFETTVGDHLIITDKPLKRR